MSIVLACTLLALQLSKPVEAPRLVVVIAVDQMIPEQLQRLQSRFNGGFARFLKDGAMFWRATVDYAGTETGPGHATLATGRYPLHHGIIGNLFVDRGVHELVYCVADKNSHLMGANGIDTVNPGVSPAYLIGDALGDIIAKGAPASKTVAISGKDRSAILLGGRAPDAALWWHGTEGGFTSSSYYGEKLPEFVGVWNKAWKERARGWQWSSLLEGDLSLLGTAPDEREGEVKLGGHTLPRTLPSEDAALPLAVLFSPLVDFFTLELATLAVDSQGLGQDDALDFLGISLSGCDLLGHSYGPDSVEVTDLLTRDDRDLGRFLQMLDDKVGKGRWIACLSADHGVLDLPELLQQHEVGARRVKGAEVIAMRKSVEESIEAAFPGHPDLGVRYAFLGFTLDEAKTTAAGIAPAELRQAIAEGAEQSEWVEDAYTLEQLLGTDAAADGATTDGATTDPWLALYRRSQRPERGADVVLRPDPWLLFDFPEGTSHGSPYPYDRRVPLAFLGAKVKAQQRFDAASPTDAVPTLLGLLGIKAPSDLDGRALKVD